MIATSRPRLARQITGAAIAVLMAAPPMVAAQASLRVERQPAGLTIVATDTRLDDILRALALQTGSRIAGLEHASDRVTVELHDVSVVEALRVILGDAHVNYLYSPRPKVSAEAALVWLYGALPPRPGGPEGIVVDALATADEAPASGYAPKFPDNEVTRLSREGAFDVHATQASLLGLAASPDPDVRIMALQTLALQPTAATKDAVRAALADSNIFVRGEALVLASSLGMGANQVALLGELLDNANPEVRSAAVLTLSSLQGDEARRLIERAMRDENGSVRALAGQAQRQQQGGRKQQR